MKTLVICNNSYQLIVAIQLKLTIFSDRKVDVWLTDNLPKAEDLVEHLRLCEIFENVKFVKCHDNDYAKGIKNKIRSIYELTFKTNRIDSFKCEYEEIVFKFIS